MRKYHAINYITLGSRISKRRAELQLSQKQIAEVLDCNESYVSKIETGKAHPSLDFLYLLAKHLEVGMDYFFPDTVDGAIIIKDEINEKWATYSPEMLQLMEKIASDISCFEQQLLSKSNFN